MSKSIKFKPGHKWFGYEFFPETGTVKSYKTGSGNGRFMGGQGSGYTLNGMYVRLKDLHSEYNHLSSAIESAEGEIGNEFILFSSKHKRSQYFVNCDVQTALNILQERVPDLTGDDVVYVDVHTGEHKSLISKKIWSV